MLWSRTGVERGAGRSDGGRFLFERCLQKGREPSESEFEWRRLQRRGRKAVGSALHQNRVLFIFMWVLSHFSFFSFLHFSSFYNLQNEL